MNQLFFGKKTKLATTHMLFVGMLGNVSVATTTTSARFDKRITICLRHQHTFYYIKLLFFPPFWREKQSCIW